MKNKTLDQKYRFNIVKGCGLVFESRYYAQKFIKEVLEPLEDVNVYYEIITDNGVAWINAVSKRRIDYDDLPVVIL